MADEIIVKYVADVKNLEAGLNKISGRLDAVEKKAQKSSKGITTSLKGVAGAMGVAFGAQQAIQLGREMVNLAAKAEGVERAFKRIGSPQLLADLRKATRGTVSDLVLMQNAIKASNFKIPLDQMATLLKFAGARARETGESVEYLVNSIIMGIGRKSPMILDNLGISAIELRKRFDGISVASANVADVARIVGDIANEELAKMGVQADTTADKLAQIETTWENIKTKGGEALITLGSGLGRTLGILEEFDPKLAGINKAMGTLTSWRLQDLNDGTKELSDIYLEIELQLKKVNKIKAEEEKLGTSSTDRKRRAEIIEQLAVQEAKLEALRNVFESYKKTLDSADKSEKEQLKNLLYYDTLIENLKEQQKGANITREKVRDLELEINQATEERLKLLGKLTPAEKEAAKALKEALKLDLDDDDINFDVLADQLKATTDDFVGESERATSIASDVWGSHFENLMMDQDEFYAAMRQNTETQEELQKDVLESTLQAWSTFTNLAAQLSDIQYQRQFNSLDNALKKEEITREEYERRKAELAKEQYKKQKQYAIIMAAINTALGITNALATAPNIIAGLALAIGVAVAGAAEIAVIASQPMPQFAMGGWVDSKGHIHGHSHAQGGVTIEAEGDEFITRGKYARTNSRLLEAINSGNAENYINENHVAPIVDNILSGGMGAIGDSARLNAMFSDRNMLRAFDRNRQSERNSAKLIVDGITKGLSKKSKDRYV